MADQPPPLSGGGAYTRRQLLKVGAILGTVGAAGFGAIYWDGGESTTETSLPEGIPSAAQFVTSGEMRTVLSDESFHDAIEAELTTQEIENISSLNGFLDSIGETTGVDPREIGTTTVFGAATGPETGVGAVIFEANIDSIRVVLADAGILAEQSEYKGFDLYAVEIEGLESPDGEAIGADIQDGLDAELVVCELGDGEFAAGTRREIEGVIDIRRGNRPGLDDTLARAVESVAAEELRFGFLLPENLFTVLGLPEGVSQLIDLGEFEYGYGSVVDGELTVTIRAVSADAAGDLASQLTSISRILAASGDSGIIDFPPEIRGQLLDVLTAIDVGSDGRLVTVTVPDGYQLAASVLVYSL